MGLRRKCRRCFVSTRSAAQPSYALSRDLEAARYAADRAFRQYDAADLSNRLVASELEARWKRVLAHAAEVEGKIAMHDAATPAPIADPASLGVLASNSLKRSGMRRRRMLASRSALCAPSSMRSWPISTTRRPRSFSSSTGWVALIASCACPSAGADSATELPPILSRPSIADRRRRSDCRPPQPQRPQDGQQQSLDPTIIGSSRFPMVGTGRCTAESGWIAGLLASPS